MQDSGCVQRRSARSVQMRKILSRSKDFVTDINNRQFLTPIPKPGINCPLRGTGELRKRKLSDDEGESPEGVYVHRMQRISIPKPNSKEYKKVTEKVWEVTPPKVGILARYFVKHLLQVTRVLSSVHRVRESVRRKLLQAPPVVVGIVHLLLPFIIGGGATARLEARAGQGGHHLIMSSERSRPLL